MAEVDPKFKSLGKVAVIGGCGFLGQHLVAQIIAQFPESIVAALDVRLTYHVEDKRVSYHSVDITDAAAVKIAFKDIKPDVVFHTAALVPSPTTPDSLTRKVNYEGTVNVLEAAKESGVKAFVYTSSSSVIAGGGSKELINADETWPLLTGPEQPDIYSRMKALGEAEVLKANRSSKKFLTCAVRPATIFGEYDTQVLYRPCQITGFKTYMQLGDNNNLFDYTYVGNVVHAHLLAARALIITGLMNVTPLDIERVDGEAFIVTNGSPVYFWDAMRIIWKARGTKADKEYDMKRVWVIPSAWAIFIAGVLEMIMMLFGRVPNMTRHAVRQSTLTKYYCIDKARLRLKYEPIYSLEEGIERGVKEVMARLRREKKAP